MQQHLKALFSQAPIYEGEARAHHLLPDETHDEIVFCGRSNVGKSSLINALFYQQKLARISKTPGRTQALYFYLINDCLRLVDLPGHGYAKVSKKDVAKWQKFVNEYLLSRRRLKAVFLLLDCRVGVKPADIEALEIIKQAGVICYPIMTKIDKLSREKQILAKDKIMNNLSDYAFIAEQIHGVSSSKSYGLDELRTLIAGFM